MVGQEEDEGRLEDTTEIGNAGEMILLEKAHRLQKKPLAITGLLNFPFCTQQWGKYRAVHAYARMQSLRTQ